ncbi:ankyrin repeat domain-containing protein [Ralstonia sp. 24A2]|uniref:ankyrin repeat domain-containing protein n=1 Tax=Ralstonia sp. 24A2 TaxID=3447364 RepID=UPI003F69A5E9
MKRVLAVALMTLSGLVWAKDGQLTCQDMRTHPARVFTGDVDLGSGSGSPIDVDYGCPESLAGQKFMQKLLALAEQIRAEDGPQVCTGTIIKAHWRYYNFSLAEAGFSPQTLARHGLASPPVANWASFARAKRDERNADVIPYFKQWAEQSPSNLALYNAFTAEFDRTLPILIAHYERKLGLPRKAAQAAASSAMWLVLLRATGSFMKSDLQPQSTLLDLVRNSRTSPAEIAQALSSGKDDPDAQPDTEVYRALATALLNNRSVQIVAPLVDRLPPEALQRLGKGNEPLLSFAVKDTQNLAYLLGKGAPVNAANDFGKTALFYAIDANNHDTAGMLLQAGADVNQAYKSAKELRPGDDECVYPNLRHTRRTPLMHAAQHGDVEMIKLLLQAGARLDAADDLGYNALDYAALGSNKDNARYLKSLGLELGAPKYTSDKDPAVREHGLLGSLAINGYVSKLVTAPGRPDLLVAAVLPWDTNTLGESHGLYLISLTQPDRPEVIAKFVGTRVDDFALSPDGKRAYIMETGNQQSPLDKRFGIAVLDITNPEKPSVKERIAGDFMTMHLSPDARRLYLQERSLNPDFSRGLLVYNVGNGPATMQCRNPFGEIKYRGPVFAYAFASFSDEPVLVIHDSSRALLMFDVTAPCAPRKLTEARAADFGGPMTGTVSRTIFVRSDGITKLRVADGLERKTSYEGVAMAFHVNANTGITTAVFGTDVAVLRSRPAGQFVLTDRFRPPSSNVGSVLLTDSGYVYMGWNGGLGVGLVPMDAH